MGPGSLAYLAAWDVHRARLFGRCERKNSIAAFVSLTTVFDVATQESWSRYVMFRDMFSSAN